MAHTRRSRGRERRPSTAAAAFLMGCAAGALLGAAGAGADTQSLFRTHSPRVVQVRIVEGGSGSKRSIGSGFVVGDGRHLVTNYHVVSEIVHHPERYEVEILDAEDATRTAELLGFDVVHDLAVLRAEGDFSDRFELHEGNLEKGDRIFSFGNPYDLGMSVVEGTYNGTLEHSRYRRIHFTGSLNPGMSGGPALVADGRVVGVNVASAGNQVSFLVPVAHVSALLARVRDPSLAPAQDHMAELKAQLWAHQEEYLAEMLATPIETVRLGPFEAPTRPAPYFNCWGDAIHDDEYFYEGRSHACFAQDRIFVSDEQSFVPLQLRHRQLESTALGASRFYALYTSFFEGNHSEHFGSEDDYTAFRCRTRFVTSRGLAFKTAFCARRYLEFEGLYDAVFKAAVLGRDGHGLETALLLSAVSFEGAERLARRHLEAIAWSE